MTTLKLTCLVVAVLVVGLASGFLAQTGLGATVHRDIDVPWIDRTLVGAHPGSDLRLIEVGPCRDCEAASDLSIASLDETRLIAERLDELTVPLLRIDGLQIGYVDLRQIEQVPVTTIQ